jgi:acyl-CoA synthetase (AMP-forming)/AMP-acid ligase II
MVLPLLPHAEARAGGDGRLELRASSLLTCYAELMDDVVRARDPRRDGWFATDDLGVVHPEGIEVLGRASDTVKVLGELVPLGKVEAEARRWADQEPALRGLELDLAVVGTPHPRLGHQLVLVLAPGNQEAARRLNLDAVRESLDRFSADSLLPFEKIRSVVTAARIPRTALGKCRRQLLLREVGLEP